MFKVDEGKSWQTSKAVPNYFTFSTSYRKTATIENAQSSFKNLAYGQLTQI
jgi:hypothetical protein